MSFLRSKKDSSSNRYELAESYLKEAEKATLTTSTTTLESDIDLLEKIEKFNIENQSHYDDLDKQEKLKDNLEKANKDYKYLKTTQKSLQNKISKRIVSEFESIHNNPVEIDKIPNINNATEKFIGVLSLNTSLSASSISKKDQMENLKKVELISNLIKNENELKYDLISRQSQKNLNEGELDPAAIEAYIAENNNYLSKAENENKVKNLKNIYHGMLGQISMNLEDVSRKKFIEAARLTINMVQEYKENTISKDDLKVISKSPEHQEYNEYMNRIIEFVKQDIYNEKDHNKRALTLERWVAIANSNLAKKDYLTAYAINSVLVDSQSTLKKTHDALSDQTKENLKLLNDKLQPFTNTDRAIVVFDSEKGKCIPVMPIYGKLLDSGYFKPEILFNSLGPILEYQTIKANQTQKKQKEFIPDNLTKDKDSDFLLLTQDNFKESDLSILAKIVNDEKVKNNRNEQLPLILKNGQTLYIYALNSLNKPQFSKLFLDDKNHSDLIKQFPENEKSKFQPAGTLKSNIYKEIEEYSNIQQDAKSRSIKKLEQGFNPDTNGAFLKGNPHISKFISETPPIKIEENLEVSRKIPRRPITNKEKIDNRSFRFDSSTSKDTMGELDEMRQLLKMQEKAKDLPLAPEKPQQKITSTKGIFQSLASKTNTNDLANEEQINSIPIIASNDEAYISRKPIRANNNIINTQRRENLTEDKPTIENEQPNTPIIKNKG